MAYPDKRNPPAEEEQSKRLVKANEKAETATHCCGLFKRREVTIDSKNLLETPDIEEGENNSPEAKIKPVSTHELLKFADSYDWFLMLTGAIGGTINGSNTVVFAILLGMVIDSMGGSSDSDRTTKETTDLASTVFACLIPVYFIAGFMQVMGFTITSERQSLRIRKEYLAKVLNQEIGWFDENGGGSISAEIAENTVRIREGIVNLGGWFQFGGTGIMGVILGFVFSWKITLVILGVCMPLLILAGVMKNRAMQKRSNAALDSYGRAGAIATEAFENMRTVVSFNAQDKIANKYLSELKDAEKSGVNNATFIGIGTAFVMGLFFVCYSIVFYYGAVLVRNDRKRAVEGYDPSLSTTGCLLNTVLSMCNNNTYSNFADMCTCIECECGCYANDLSFECMQGGNVTTVFFGVILAANALGQMGPLVQSLDNAKISARRIFNLLERKSATDEDDASGLKPENIHGRFEFKDVHFHYPTRPDHTILRGLNLEVEAGTSVALVGGSGCGKSTAIALVQRFYEPVKGDVLLDGTSLKDFNLAYLRSHIGMVGQEPVLFATSIAENIAYGVPVGQPKPSREEIIKAAQSANAYEFISGFPDQFETHVGARGGQLSGGQKQRIALARAIIRNAPILILDEATSALDNESERIVQAALDKLQTSGTKRTTFIIAHRLSTVRNADKIVVLGGGGVLEQGSHDELSQISNGHYAALLAAAGNDAAATGETQDEQDVKMILNNLQLKSGSMTSTQGLESSRRELLRKRASEYKSMRMSIRLGEDPLAKMESSRMQSIRMQSTRMQSKRSLKYNASTKNLASSFLSHSQIFSDLNSKRSLHPPASNQSLISKSSRKMVNYSDKDVESSVPEEDDEALYSVPLSRLFGLSRPEKCYYVPGIIGAALIGALLPVQGILFSYFTTVFYLPSSEEMMDDARMYALIFVGLGCAAFGATFAKEYSFTIIGEKMTTRVRDLLFRAIIKQEISFYDDPKNSVGTLSAILATEAPVVKAGLSDRIGLIMSNIFTMCVGLGVAFGMGWQLALCLLLFFPLLIMSFALRFKMQDGMNNAEGSVMEDASQILAESVSGIRTVASFGNRTRVIALYAEKLEPAFAMGTRKGYVSGAGFGLSGAVLFVLHAVAFFVGGILVNNGTFDQQTFTIVLMSTIFTAVGAGQATAMAPDVSQASEAISNVFRIVDREPAMDYTSDGGVRGDASAAGSFTLQNVSFAYPQRPDHIVFSNVSLDIEGGKCIALVGGSGSGKSTIIGLIERYYDPIRGRVSFDDVPDLKDLNLRWLRDQVGLVGQEPKLFAGSIRENIALGKQGSEATMEEIIEATKSSNAHDFIIKFPEGYDTIVGEGNLSGGQKQRICIARAMIRKPRVLLLDEATAALDNESEHAVQSALDHLVETNKMTTITVAHRLTTIQNADKIVVIEKGVVKEQGTHTELLAKGEMGSYYKLWNAQNRKE